MNKFLAFFKNLFAKFSPVVQATLAQAATNVAIEVGTIGFNILMARAGQAVAGADVKYVGKDGSVKYNAVRDELAAFAVNQGISVSQSALRYIIENAHAAQPGPGA